GRALSQQRRRYVHRCHEGRGDRVLGARFYRRLGGLQLRRPPGFVRAGEPRRRVSSQQAPSAVSQQRQRGVHRRDARGRAAAVGATWGDYDNDGYPDLFLSSAFGRSQLFHNNGDGTFTDVSKEAGVDRPCFGMVAYFCDIDNDGWLDLVQYLWCSNDEMIHSL